MKMLKQNENVSMSMNYAEYITSVKCEGALLIKRIAVTLLFLLLFSVGTWAICGGVINAPPLELLVIAICGIGYFFAFGRLKIEYEYIIASAKVEFDAIYAQRKRKEIITVSLDDAERIAPYNAAAENYIKSKNISKIYDFSSSKNSKRKYFMLLNQKGTNIVIFFDAVSKTLDVFKFFRSSIVEIDKEIYEM